MSVTKSLIQKILKLHNSKQVIPWLRITAASRPVTESSLTSESHFVNLTCGFYAPAGLQRSSEGQPAHFTVVCRDSAGDQLTRGGEHVVVSVAHREKKDWWVWLVKKGKKGWTSEELRRSFTSSRPAAGSRLPQGSPEVTCCTEGEALLICVEYCLSRLKWF